ncbi:Carboxymuconolactone decarboxylase family protein [Maioricimonas rarisocia]|uniref:Carboxymuconolactone decarboxylase family protein n=1 Tax=Maioricimonas rarisocia TaxID=2528026 RepID=A0A517Z373_9PLAN|nr:carboxymuconolactone decarboxylase family protein [Maioricimonas rarisocia]QDU36944.1 Carboxymuconolactone decarboxylase family protein [Maioricimonas rarisocia]
MAEFPVHTAEAAGESGPLLEKSQKAYGFVPNLHAVMAESPAMLEAYQALSDLFTNRTSLNPTEQQIIAMTNNRLNGCTYCMAAHTTIMQKARVPEDVITALREGTPIADPKLEALRAFAEKINVSRGWPDESDIETLLAAGYTRQTVLEVIVGTAYKVLSNYTNHVAETPLDEAFAANEWNADTQSVG